MTKPSHSESNKQATYSSEDGVQAPHLEPPSQVSTEQQQIDEQWMRQALALAEQAAAQGEVPVGALVVRDGVVLGEGKNGPIGQCDPSAHAEIQALRAACAKERNYRLPGATLYVTIEPCTMCAGAIVHARVDRVVFGATEPKAGAVVSQSKIFELPCMNTQVDYAQGILAQQCSELMSRFFSERRARKKELKRAAKLASRSE